MQCQLASDRCSCSCDILGKLVPLLPSAAPAERTALFLLASRSAKQQQQQLPEQLSQAQAGPWHCRRLYSPG